MAVHLSFVFLDFQVLIFEKEGDCFLIFLHLSFFSFSYLLVAVIDLLLSLLSVQKVMKKYHWDGRSYHREATCSRRKFCSEIFNLNFWEFSSIFQAPLTQSLWLTLALTWTWVKMMQTLVKADYVTSGTKDNTLHCWLWLA